MCRIYFIVLALEIFHCATYINFESNSVVFEQLTSLEDVIMEKLFHIERKSHDEGLMLSIDLAAFYYYFDELFKGLHAKNSTYESTYEYLAKRNGPLFLQKNFSEDCLKKKYFFQRAHFDEVYELLDRIKDVWTKIKTVIKSKIKKK